MNKGKKHRAREVLLGHLLGHCRARADGRGGRSAKADSKKIGSLLGIMRYILRYKFSVAIVVAAAIAGNMLALLIPRLTGEMVDLLTGRFSAAGNPLPVAGALGGAAALLPAGAPAGPPDIVSALVSYALTIAGVSLLSWVLSVVQNLIMLRTAQNVVKRLRHDVFAKLMTLPVSFFDTRAKGDIISVVAVDIDNVSETVSADAVTLISGFVTVVGALFMMAAISPPLMLIFAVTVPGMAVAARFISKRSRLLHHRRKNAFGKMCGYAEEMITAQKTVKAYGLEDYNMGMFKGINADLNAKGAKAEFQSSCMMPTMNGVSNLNFTLICLFGAFFVLNGRMSIGGISSFVMYAKRFSQPIVDTANIINMFQASLAACDRVFAILNMESEEEVVGSEDPRGRCGERYAPLEPLKRPTASRTTPRECDSYAARGGIRLENVQFSYTPDAPVLRGISADIRPGDCVAVVGATGSGKTTLVSLLLRFYNVTGGRILLDGRDIRDIPLAELRRNFALVLQDSWLFEGTVYENIAYASPLAAQAGNGGMLPLALPGAARPEQAGLERIRRMCGEIRVDEFIRSLPGGYNAVLHNDSGGLSQGQKQLINIARAFLCDMPVFILDEATSSVDTLIEQQIQQVTERVIKGRTSIIIAHRLSTILRADVILVMKDGLICERGNHEALMEKGGVYKTLYESQFEDGES